MNLELLIKLKNAFNNHNVDLFADCLDENYQSEQPVHPDRSFTGKEQAVKNWAANFSEMPDFAAELLDYSLSETTLWTEWYWTGTRKDNSKLHMRGVTIFGVEENKIKWGRLYVEPVETNGAGIEAAVKEVMHGKKGG
jgi:hypothetical protein